MIYEFLCVRVGSMLALSLLAMFVAYKIKFRWLTFVWAILSSLFISLQLVSLYMTDSFIGYQFYLHLNARDIMAMSGLFIGEFVASLVVFAALTFLILSAQKVKDVRCFRWNCFTKNSFVLKWLFTGLCIAVLLQENGVIVSSVEMARMLSADAVAFSQALDELGFDDYVTPEGVRAKKGKNIIVISLESFERGYLRPKLNHLTPNLTQLSKSWNYFDMEEVVGCSWTSGSLYGCITGMPALFNRHGNSIFEGSCSSNITGLSHVLNKAGYDVSYLANNSSFSGTNHMLYTLGFDQIIDETLAGGTKLHDKDLFELAEEQLKKKGGDKPFALFMSTLSTHFPDGIYDSRMRSFVEPQNSNLEFMVSATDFLIGRFMKFLEYNGFLENTVVYILPDHLKMGGATIFEGTGQRSLYVITNGEVSADKGLFSQLHLPKIILDGAEIETNAKFLVDYITEDTVSGFINKWKDSIVRMNLSGFKRLNSNIVDELKDAERFAKYSLDRSRFIAHGGGEVDGVRYTNSLEAMNESYDNGFRLFELDIIKTKDGHYVASHDWQHWAKITGYTGELPVTREKFLEYKIYKKYTPMDMVLINKWFLERRDAVLVTDKINNPKEMANVFCDKSRLMMELFTLDAVKEGIDVGIRSSIPSATVLKKLGNGLVEKLVEIGVKDIALSRRTVVVNKELMAQIKRAGIRAYAFHVNFDQGKDEEYMVRHEMDLIHGIYADKWKFKDQFNKVPEKGILQ